MEGTLSIHSIVTERHEVFYWAAVLATFALGTVAGDLTAVTFGPLGASFADRLAVSSKRGGLAIGTGLVSFVLGDDRHVRGLSDLDRRGHSGGSESAGRS